MAARIASPAAGCACAETAKWVNKTNPAMLVNLRNALIQPSRGFDNTQEAAGISFAGPLLKSKPAFPTVFSLECRGKKNVCLATDVVQWFRVLPANL
jgi:hypothetical protein